MISRKFWFSILATMLLLGGCFTARGQSTFGSISGTVKDASGAAFTSAHVAMITSDGHIAGWGSPAGGGVHAIVWIPGGAQ